MEKDNAVSYSKMLEYFARNECDDKKKRSGLFAYHIKRLVKTKLVKKDTESGFYFITMAGKYAIKGAKILEKALEEKTLNDVNKQGKLVFKVYRN